MTDTIHLHQEAKVLPVKTHSEMLTKQYLLSMHQRDHPNHHQLSEPRPPRHIRSSIHDFSPSIQNHIGQNLHLTKEEYKKENKKIHTDTVTATITSYPANKILLSAPPEINKEEKELPRKTRTTLSQLRSRYSPFLNSYLNRINRADTDQCPKCHNAEHTSLHLFNCNANPTDLRPTDLWTQPKKTAEFLELPVTTAQEDDLEDPG